MELIKTKVKFLKYIDYEGDIDVYAIFPDIKGNKNKVLVYSIIGQHSSATLEYINLSTPANKSESFELEKELKQIGYIL